MRMADSRARADFLDAHSSGLDGVICHTVKFCDSYSFEYEKLRRENRIQLLKLETDLTAQCEGQISTRVEAFIESLHAQKDGTGENGGEDTGRGPASAESGTGSARGSADTAQGGTGAARKENGMDRIIVMGIDSGSTSTNGVIMDGTGRILAAGSVRTGAGTIDSSAAIREQLLQEAGLTQADILRTVATGYGRAAIPFAGGSVTEISCHARGARYFDPHVMTILDIGGQDSKAIRLNEKGEVTDFVMNDKCAAGTGRFLEAMARTLEVEIGELGPISLQSTEEVEISSMCTVFAESEVISLIAQNKKKADIAHGVHRAIAGKAVALLNRVDPAPAYMMTGGVARNPGVVKAVEEKLHAELFICEQPDIVGAVGAALCALDAAK
jgi:predicted CoA-substrate-specific enzyme activase